MGYFEFLFPKLTTTHTPCPDMLRTIVLLAPVFVSLFWAVTLAGDKKKYGAPRLFLSKFMFLVAVIFARHYIFFAPYPELFVYFDMPYQLLGLCIFPLYHIYFRLLMVDKKFPLMSHLWFLVLPLIEVLIYGIAVLFSPPGEYHAWLLNQAGETGSASIRFLNGMLVVMRVTFLVSLVLTVIGNLRLIKKYEGKALEYYSDVMDSGQRNVKVLNYSILALSLFTFAFVVVGRVFLMPKDWLIYTGWALFTILLYFMGNLGMKQKMLNPCFENADMAEGEAMVPESAIKDANHLAEKITAEFAVNKIYLDNELNISDLVKKLGSNRTYISYVINHEFNQNFSSYVNSYRIEELKLLLAKNQRYTNQELAERCGFGTINSMKRSVYLKTGLSFHDFKKQ
jgi:AraC-like DNA-binding protein